MFHNAFYTVEYIADYDDVRDINILRVCCCRYLFAYYWEEEMNHTIGTYYIGLRTEDELTLDYGDLVGIFHQLCALANGYDAMPFSCVEVDEKMGLVWEKA